MSVRVGWDSFIEELMATMRKHNEITLLDIPKNAKDDLIANLDKWNIKPSDYDKSVPIGKGFILGFIHGRRNSH